MKELLVAAITLLVVGCGIRGDPKPPSVPAELGRGKPSYRRATEGLALPPPGTVEEDETEEEEPSDDGS